MNLTDTPVIDDKPAVLETCLEEPKVNQTSTSHSLLNSSKVVNVAEALDCMKFSKLSDYYKSPPTL